MWSGTAASVVDLHSSLTGLGHTFTDSEAHGISDTGDIVGFAYVAVGFIYAVLWKPVLGDYNGDGKVDAADYVVWRKAAGPQSDYDTWRANFGQTAGSGSGTSASATVPEPASLVLLMFAATGWCLRRLRAASRVPRTRGE